MLSNPTNNQFIANKISSTQGVTCSKPSLMTGGGPYGVTNDSLNLDAQSGLGKARASVLNHPSKCDLQKGGAAGHDYDADAVGQTYGYTKSGAAIAGELRGSYAPITVQPKTNMCGGKKKRRKSKKKRKNRRKNKSRKSRKRRKSKRRRRRGGMGIQMPVVDKGKLPRELKEAYNSRDKYSSDPEYAMKYPTGLTNSIMKIQKLENQIREMHGDEKLKEIQHAYKKSVCDDEPGTYTNYGVIDCGKKGGKRRRRKSRRKSKSRKKRRRRTRKRMKGGRYQQYGSNVPNTPSYSAPYTAGPMPWATGPVGINRQINC